MMFGYLIFLAVSLHNLLNVPVIIINFFFFLIPTLVIIERERESSEDNNQSFMQPLDEWN